MLQVQIGLFTAIFRTTNEAAKINMTVFDKVTPREEFCPERYYLADGAHISCHDIKTQTLLFKLEMASPEIAQMLMTDLYYGEYTGA